MQMNKNKFFIKISYSRMKQKDMGLHKKLPINSVWKREQSLFSLL